MRNRFLEMGLGDKRLPMNEVDFVSTQAATSGLARMFDLLDEFGENTPANRLWCFLGYCETSAQGIIGTHDALSAEREKLADGLADFFTQLGEDLKEFARSENAKLMWRDYAQSLEKKRQLPPFKVASPRLAARRRR